MEINKCVLTCFDLRTPTKVLIFNGKLSIALELLSLVNVVTIGAPVLGLRGYRSFLRIKNGFVLRSYFVYRLEFNAFAELVKFNIEIL